MQFRLFILILSLSITSFATAEDWPGWRGPRGDGSSLSKNLPTNWDASNGSHIVWKKPILGEGHASPIVWDDRIFVSTCDTESKKRQLICLDQASGNTLWTKVVFEGPLETIHTLNSRASATPVTDGSLVFVTYQKVGNRKIPAPNVGTPRLITAGDLIVAAYDFSGNRKWLVQPGPFISAHGFSNCPVLYEDMVIVNADHDGDSYVIALDKKTGAERWRFNRKYKTRSYVTPLIRKIGKRTQMVFSGSKRIVSLDPENGKLHWKIEGPTEQFVASMVYDDGLFFMTCGFPDYHVMGIQANGSGDVTDTKVQWQTQAARSYVPSPVVVDGHLVVADDRGTANCFDAKTGKRLWNARLGKGFNASLIHANGLAYLTAKDGTTKVIRPGPKLEVIGEGKLGEEVSASPAVAGDRLLLRTHSHLFCIAK